MWTTVFVITLYSSVWCIHGHIQWFMPHNLLFPKVASPSQCASLWRDVQHARVRWLCWQILRTFQTWNRLWREAERVAKFIQNVTNIFIFHLTQSFRPATSSGHLQSDEIPDGKITHRYTAANHWKFIVWEVLSLLTVFCRFSIHVLPYKRVVKVPG